MNSREVFFGRCLDPGDGMLPRKRFAYLAMQARVYQEATNLLPPLDPPQPPPMPEPVVVHGPQNNFIRRKPTRVVNSSIGLPGRSNRVTKKNHLLQRKKNCRVYKLY